MKTKFYFILLLLLGLSDVAMSANDTKTQPTPLAAHISELRHYQDESVQKSLKLLDAGMCTYLDVLKTEENVIRTRLQEKNITKKEKKSLSDKLKRNIQLQKELNQKKRAVTG